jgi:SAM-dependent methyltransferase
VSVSTLEHVGMSNERYGVDDERTEDPDVELAAAVRELRRVAKPGGTLLITVPVRPPRRPGLVPRLRPPARRPSDRVARAGRRLGAVYRYDASGWQLSDLDAAARRRLPRAHADPSPADLAPNARAVACCGSRSEGPDRSSSLTADGHRTPSSGPTTVRRGDRESPEYPHTNATSRRTVRWAFASRTTSRRSRRTVA